MGSKTEWDAGFTLRARFTEGACAKTKPVAREPTSNRTERSTMASGQMTSSTVKESRSRRGGLGTRALTDEA